MRVYIVSENTDKRGQLTKMIQLLRGIQEVPRIFLCGQNDILADGQGTRKDVDELIKKHFSIEDLLKE